MCLYLITSLQEERQNRVSLQLKEVFQKCKYLSLALDESIAISDIRWHLVFIHTIDKHFTGCKELLEVSPLHGTTEGIDIYSATPLWKSLMHSYGGFERCACVDSVHLLGDDRAKVWTHQEAIHMCKLLQMSDIMINVTSIVNIIKRGNRTQRHWKFIQFLKDMGAQYEDVQAKH